MRRMKSSYERLVEIAAEADHEIAEVAVSLVEKMMTTLGESPEAWRGAGEMATVFMSALNIDRLAFQDAWGDEADKVPHDYRPIVSVLSAFSGLLLAHPLMIQAVDE